MTSTALMTKQCWSDSAVESVLNRAGSRVRVEGVC